MICILKFMLLQSVETPILPITDADSLWNFSVRSPLQLGKWSVHTFYWYSRQQFTGKHLDKRQRYHLHVDCRMLLATIAVLLKMFKRNISTRLVLKNILESELCAIESTHFSLAQTFHKLWFFSVKYPLITKFVSVAEIFFTFYLQYLFLQVTGVKCILFFFKDFLHFKLYSIGSWSTSHTASF